MSWSLDKAGGMWCDAGVRKRLERFQMARLFSMHRVKVQGSVSKSLVFYRMELTVPEAPPHLQPLPVLHPLEATTGNVGCPPSCRPCWRMGTTT